MPGSGVRMAVQEESGFLCSQHIDKNCPTPLVSSKKKKTQLKEKK